MTTITQYRNLLGISKHRLDDELEIQAEVQDRISTQVTIRNSRMLEAKETLTQIEAELVADYTERGDSVKAAEAKAKTSQKRRTAWVDFQRERAEHEEWVGLYQAWRDRGIALQSLGRLHGQQYFAVNSAGGERKSPKQEDYDELRAATRRDHHSRTIQAEKQIDDAPQPRRRRVLTDE